MDNYTGGEHLFIHTSTSKFKIAPELIFNTMNVEDFDSLCNILPFNIIISVKDDIVTECSKH